MQERSTGALAQGRERERQRPDPLPRVELGGADSSATNHQQVKAQKQHNLAHLRVGNHAKRVQNEGHGEDPIHKVAEENHAPVTDSQKKSVALYIYYIQPLWS